MKVALAQSHLPLGDFERNSKQVLKLLKASQNKADLLVFPEGGLWGYPPKDFLYDNRYFKIQEKKLKLINKHLTKDLGLILPAFIKNKEKIQNGAFFFAKNKKPLFFAKEFLPDEGVFFESRYFKKGSTINNFFYWKNKKIQLLICEDLWRVSPQKPADLLIAVNASPYTDQKQKNRLKKMKELTKKYKCPSLYLNCVGAQDSLIFDGGSFALNQKADLIWQGEFFKPDFKILKISKNNFKKTPKVKPFLNLQQQRHQALILGIKEFFFQTGFKKALLGLSGGIDSALVAYLAVQALGKNNVHVYFLPGPYSHSISFKMVSQLMDNLKIKGSKKSIQPLFEVFSAWLFDKKQSPHSLTAQNLQARIRSTVLMSFANKTSSLLLACGNKSEMATGYVTLYGDLSGALCPLADLLKSQVYDLAHFINKTQKVFPKELFSREPSAELAPQQKDRDDLPPYKKLDPMLENIFKDLAPKSPEEKKLRKLVQKQEFKRFQAPVILKLSERDLGESWKKPLAHTFPLA